MSEPNSTSWGSLPTVSHKDFEYSNDPLNLVVLNLNNGAGFALHSSRPFVVFLKTARHIATGISADSLNAALSNLYKAGACVIERRDTMFMFYLEYPDEPNIPFDPPARVDEKLAASWFDDLEALRIRPPVAQESITATEEDDNTGYDGIIGL